MIIVALVHPSHNSQAATAWTPRDTYMRPFLHVRWLSSDIATQNFNMQQNVLSAASRKIKTEKNATDNDKIVSGNYAQLIK